MYYSFLTPTLLFGIRMRTLMGCVSLKLDETQKFMYDSSANLEYKHKWDRFFNLAKKVGDDTKGICLVPKFYIPKIQPRNQILYLDRIIYLLPYYETMKSRRRRHFKEILPLIEEKMRQKEEDKKSFKLEVHGWKLYINDRII